MSSIEPDDARQSLADLEDLFEHAPCGYVIVLPNGCVGRANANFRDWTNLAETQLRTRRFTDSLSIAGKVFYETHCRPLLRMQGFVHEVALDLLAEDGTRHPVFINATEKRAADGSHLETRIIIVKASDRRRYERGLLDARNVVQSALDDERSTAELREQFIAVLGHDLRNPLAAIAGVADILRHEPLSEKGVKFLGLMQRSTQRMSRLIDNVLDFARGRLGGGLTLELAADKSIQSTLEQVVEELRVAHPGRDIRAEWSVTGDIPLDHRRIAQLASNLIGNALVHGAADRPVIVRVSGDHGSFGMVVSNTGKPISPAAMERLFQPFFREDVRASQQGLGLGLYIVAEIAQAHGGTVDVASDDRETRFSVRIPTRAKHTA